MFDNRFAFQRGDYHFTLPIGGKLVGYAYIRKNGCSAFKRAAGLSPSAHIGELVERFPWQPRTRHDAIIFVWRDPVKRLISLYRNKFLDAKNPSDIVSAYRHSMKEEPTTFERFVEFAVKELDPHCLPQYKHLKPIRYTHAIPLEALHQGMLAIVGEEASEPFRQRTNASSEEPVNVSPRAHQMIRRHYAKDFRMIESIKRAKK